MFYLLDLFLQPLAKPYCIDAPKEKNAQNNGLVAIVVGRVLDRLYICFPDCCDIAQRDRPLGPGNRYENVADLLYGFEPAQCFDDNFHIVDVQPAAGAEDILLLQAFCYYTGVDS